MPSNPTTVDQKAFAERVCQELRASRRRQKLTQAEVAQRTGGLVSKAALANYETGHRALRIDVLWVVAGALGEDLGDLLRRAEREMNSVPHTGIVLNVAALQQNRDPQLDGVRRWLHASGNRTQDTVQINGNVLGALATIMRLPQHEAERLLKDSNLIAS